MYDGTAVFPTQTNIACARAEENAYFEPSLIYFVLADLRGKPRRIISGYGDRPYSGWHIGDTVTLHHDQAGYHMGIFKIVGWFNFAEKHGEIPTRKLPLAVLK